MFIQCRSISSSYGVEVLNVFTVGKSLILYEVVVMFEFIINSELVILFCIPRSQRKTKLSEEN